MSTIEVTIPNSETLTKQSFRLSLDALHELHLLLESIPDPDVSDLTSWDNAGVDSSAVMGLSMIFESIPPKFPVEDLLLWLWDYLVYTFGAVCNYRRVEAGLSLYARTHGI